ncbi:hypothetical protein AB0E62_14510 [Streptomyces sp. NPDC038707]|uniref:hypothetical protein n=1 Tax=unclassified Streptomyces TaxID=2593676 RepID=UPI0033DDE7F9
MRDRTSGPGEDRHRTERLSRAPGEEWTPEQDTQQDTPGTDEWTPGRASPDHRTPGRLRPEERLPGGPGRAEQATTWISGERTGGTGPSGGRPPGSSGPGREGLTGDDRTPDDTPPPPPGPAGTEGLRPGTEGLRPGTEGLRPGTDDMGAGAGPRPGTEGLGTGADQGFGASHRVEREAISEEDRMPDNGLAAPAPGEASQREATTTDSPGRDTWPTAPGASTRDAPGSAAATGAAAQPAPSGEGSPLLAREEVEEWERRIREVAVGFVDHPKGAVERADRTLEEIAARFSEAVTRRRRTLRTSWEGAEENGPGAETDTEQLRLALRDYRELAERLLHG